MIILGVDPGLSGAMAWLSASGEVLHVADLPVINEGPRRKSIDPVVLVGLLRRHEADIAIIEALHSFPSDSRPASFSLGRVYGALEALLLASGLPLRRVAPISWRRAAGLAPGAGKDAAIAAAARLCPSSRPFLTRHDRADAVLIARYGMTPVIGSSGDTRAAGNARPDRPLAHQ